MPDIDGRPFDWPARRDVEYKGAQGERHAWSPRGNVPAHLVALEEIRACRLLGSQDAADEA